MLEIRTRKPACLERKKACNSTYNWKTQTKLILDGLVKQVPIIE